jgi:hypothetical protein
VRIISKRCGEEGNMRGKEENLNPMRSTIEWMRAGNGWETRTALMPNTTKIDSLKKKKK